MLRIDVQNARSGMTLALPVMHPEADGQTLLRVGYELTEPTLRRLRQMQVQTLWINYPGLEHLRRFINPETLDRDTVVMKQVEETFTLMQQESAAKLRYEEYTSTIESLVESLMSNPDAAIYMSDLFGAGGTLMRHSASVMYLCLMMGLKLEGYLVRERKHVAAGRARDVVNLGMGAMLHDIGVTQLAEAVRLKYEQTGDESDPLWREHPSLGFRAVRGRIEPTAATVVLHHHQLANGKGYAGADFPVLSGSGIHPFARIAAVADFFDRLHRPIGMPEQPAVWVLGAMLSEPVKSRFDEQVLRALVEVVPPYPPGSRVKLSNGADAVVVDYMPSDPCRPKVQVMPDFEAMAETASGGGSGQEGNEGELDEMIDLSEVSAHLQIVECNGVGVAEFNFAASKVPGNLVSAAV
ncbi:MAG: HD domain-containing phosphohydrolase [Planctomycetota bacterium]